MIMTINPVLPFGMDFAKYVGQWVVICDNKIVAHDKNLKRIQKDIKSCSRIPTVAKIPEKDTLIF
jgi:hypothetical protein